MSETTERVAGRGLDAWIAERVMGLTLTAPDPTDPWDVPLLVIEGVTDYSIEYEVPRYSTDIDAAYLVVEAMLKRTPANECLMSVLMGFDVAKNQWRAEFLAPRGRDWSVWAGTLPLAICLAALSALDSVGETERA